MDLQRAENLARDFAPNEEMEARLRLLSSNREEFLKLPIGDRLAVGHYKEKKEAFETLRRERRTRAQV